MTGQDTEGPAQDGREETPAERLDRNLEELNSELRVVITGIQVLFAFLLIVPFDSGFASIGAFERGAYFVTLVFAAASAVCTMTPAIEHRVVFRQADKRHLVFRANRIVIAGMAFLAIAMCGALLLVSSRLFGPAIGGAVGGVAAVVFALLWFALPLRRRGRLPDPPREQESAPRARGSRGSA